MGLGNEFWESEAEEEQVRPAKVQATPPPPRTKQVPEIAVEATALIREVFPNAARRQIYHERKGIIFEIGHHGLVLKVVQNRLKAYLQEGQVIHLPIRSPNSPYPSGSKVTPITIGSGSFATLDGFAAWLSWAQHQLVRLSKESIGLAFCQDNCLGDTFYGALRAAWVLDCCGVTAAEVLCDLIKPLKWKVSDTGYSSAALLQRGMTSTPVGGMALAHNPQVETWVYGGKIDTAVNPAVAKLLQCHVQVPRNTLPERHEDAIEVLKQKANQVYAEMLLNFLYEHCNVSGLRTADLG